MTRGAPWKAALLCLLVPQLSTADKVDDIGKSLTKLDQEATNLSAAIQKPSAPGIKTGRSNTSKVVDARIAFDVGDYDTAALILFNVVEGYSGSKNRDYYEALYLLAKAFDKKGDIVGAHGYYVQLAAAGASTKYYKETLKRLVELSTTLKKNPGQWVQALERIAQGGDDNAAYILGRYASFHNQPQDALKRLGAIKPTSQFYFRAQYLIGSVQIDLKSLEDARRTYVALVKKKPTNKRDTRIKQLSYMALGRIYYALGKSGEAIAQYVMIPRKSDLFDEALYEVAWVYVKGKDFDKSLRALELLALTDAQSRKTPEVRMLEANLRIRKAQELMETREGNPKEELEKALNLFKEVKGTYERPYQELNRIVLEDKDPKLFMAQLTGRTSEAFRTQEKMPEMAAEWVRRRGEVQRILRIEANLVDVDETLNDSDDIISRLEGVLSSPSRVSAYPALAKKRARGSTIRDAVMNYRNQLLELHRKQSENRLNATDKAKLVELDTQRKQILSALGAQVKATTAAESRAKRFSARLERVERTAAEVGVVLESNRANLAALERYLDVSAEHLDSASKTLLRSEIAQAKTQVELLANELAALRKLSRTARDQVGYGGEVSAAQERLRVELTEKYQAMHDLLAKVKANGNARYKKLDRQGAVVDAKVSGMQQKIDTLVSEGLVTIIEMLKREKRNLVQYREEYLGLDQETRNVGSDVMSAGFKKVRDQLRDVVIEADVGVIDVTWSRKESTDEESKRLQVQKKRELRLLQQDFQEALGRDNR